MEAAPGARGRPVLFGYVTDGADHPDDTPDAIVVISGAAPHSFRQLRLGPVVGCLFDGDAVEVMPHHRSAGDGLAVGYIAEGRVTVEQSGRRIAAGPGQVVLYSAATPFRVSIDGPYRYLVIRVPTRQLRVHDLDNDPAFAADLSTYPSAAVLAALLRTITERAAPLAAVAAQHLGDAVADCVHAVLAEHHLDARSTLPSELFRRMAAWLDERLDDPMVSAEELARDLFLSPRYVRRVFAQQGTTVSEYVRQHRLDVIRGELLDARHADQPISAIAARWGFRDASVFSRAFSREYGESPRRFRLRHRAVG
jgi:AraC-like DNA-binding protein